MCNPKVFNDIIKHINYKDNILPFTVFTLVPLSAVKTLYFICTFHLLTACCEVVRGYGQGALTCQAVVRGTLGSVTIVTRGTQLAMFSHCVVSAVLCEHKNINSSKPKVVCYSTIFLMYIKITNLADACVRITYVSVVVTFTGNATATY